MLLSRTRNLILNRERCCRVDEREHDLKRCQKNYFRAKDLPRRCGNDRDAKSQAAELIQDAGLLPVDAGALENARYIEPLAMLMMGHGEPQRMGSDIALRLMSPAGATELVKSADVLARSFVGVFAEAPGSAMGESVLAEDLSPTFLTVVTRSVEGENMRIG